LGLLNGIAAKRIFCDVFTAVCCSANGAKHTSLGQRPRKYVKTISGLKARYITMPQSLSLVVIHIIFSTEDRQGLISESIRPRLHAYLATIARNSDCEAYRVGGVSDHVHMAIRLSRTITIADLVEELKTSSSKWMKSESPQFAWQRGYACFSVGPTDLESLTEYIDDQDKHHEKRTFQEEVRMFLKKYGVEHNETYVWD
jgi:REP element-mobilizing transposase RayT